MCKSQSVYQVLHAELRGTGQGEVYMKIERSPKGEYVDMRARLGEVMAETFRGMWTVDDTDCVVMGDCVRARVVSVWKGTAKRKVRERKNDRRVEQESQLLPAESTGEE